MATIVTPEDEISPITRTASVTPEAGSNTTTSGGSKTIGTGRSKVT